MSSANGHANAFENAAGDVLAAMYFDTAKIARTEYEYGLKPVLFPTPQMGLLFKTMCELDRAGEVVNDNTILSRIGSTIDGAWLHTIMDTYTPEVGAAFKTNCELTLDYGTRASGSRIGKILSSQFDDFEGKPTELIVSQGIDVLSALTHKTANQAVKASELGADFRAFMNAAATSGIKTGIPWVDGLTNGFVKGDVWMVAGAYKMRKTTIMLNICLHTARNGASVAFLSREMSKQEVTSQLVSMLAVGDLMTTGDYEKKNSTGQYLNWINGRGLIIAQDTYKNWNKRKVEAIDRAIDAFSAIGDRLRIYDSSPEHGALSDMDSARLAVKKDQFLYNTDVVFADYLQLFSNSAKTIYERVAYNSVAFQEIAKRDHVAVMVAAQRNEESMKGDNDEYSSGIKGGGDAAAASDFVIQTRYKYNSMVDENTVELTMKHSRHGSGGNDTKYVAPIHPNSGLLLDSDFATKCRQKFDLQFGKKTS